MFHVEHYLFIFDFIINNISFFLLCYYFPGIISMFHVKHYLFISVLLSTTSFSFYFNIISREIFLCFTWNIIYLSPFYYQQHLFLFTLLLFPGKYFYVPRETLFIYPRFYYQQHLFLFTLLLFPRKYFYVPRGTLSIYLRFYYQLHLFLFTLILFPGKYFYVSRGTLSIYLRFIINNISFFLLYNYFPGNNFIYKETFIKYFHNSFVLYETFFI